MESDDIAELILIKRIKGVFRSIRPETVLPSIIGLYSYSVLYDFKWWELCLD